MHRPHSSNRKDEEGRGVIKFFHTNDEKDKEMILKLSKELMDIQKERYKGTRNEL